MEDGGGADTNDASPTSGQREQPTTTAPVSLLPSGRRAPSDDPLLSQSQGDATADLDRTMETARRVLSELHRQGLRDAAQEAQDLGLEDAYRNGRFGAVPASSEAIACLRETAAAETREDGCAVCFQSYEEGDRIRTMPCAHGFHESCIIRWLGISRLCPLCRFALQAEAGTD
ncbi:hypothetical protein SEVIR_7G327700v4 [Setaria viridis]|uniref:RING-type domain-containing protein n=1 Tax=Setaria viridis TaxID=4556 RepID=A0A4V6D828_SETVI|nr:hypothetical protein SEVIR_7G327700v2 [Setaria viridis]